MRQPSDTVAERFEDKICETCGKSFLPAVYHQHITYEGYKKHYYCSYKCLNIHRDAIAAHSRQNVSSVMLCTADGQVIREFPCAEAAANFLSESGYTSDVRRVRESCKKGITYHGLYFKYGGKHHD